MKKIFITIICLAILTVGTTQDFALELSGLNTRSITKSELQLVNTIKDLEPGFPDSWIQSFESVQVSVQNGKHSESADGLNSTLNDDQKMLLNKVSTGDEIQFQVRYEVENSINRENSKRELQYSFTVVPATQALFPGGYEELREYIRKNAIGIAANPPNAETQLTTIQFTITTEGYVDNVRIKQSSQDEKVDDTILQSIRHMPQWTPALDEDGNKVAQHFTLNVGAALGC